MKKLFLYLFCAAAYVTVAQVKSSYLYNTNMPYGTLDLRTKITSTNYYYLQEGKTFSFREKSPGIRTNTYRDMTSWDSSPYRQGNLRHKNGTKDEFVMNYRLLLPLNYKTTYAEGYPLIVIIHGAVERANCYYNSCYHSNWDYNPNTNSPPAPRTIDHRLLNNDHNVNIGGKQHLDARNLAGSRLPNDPAMPARAFPGFVLIPQMFNVWDSLNVQDVIRIVRLHCEKYKIDQNRIYIHGLSIGGYATYQAIKRAPWLFAAALPMSAVTEAAYIFKHNQQGKVAHIPIWAFQGGLDKNPSPAFTQNVMNKFKAAGAVVKYTVYSTLGHNVWNKAYSESTFFSWMASKNKANIHPYSGNTVIVKSKAIYPKLMLAEGFFAYQWEKNGVIIATAKSNTYTATTPGTYRARFSRVSATPTASQWNRWSAPVKITEGTSTTIAARDSIEIIAEFTPEEVLTLSVYPNPTTGDNIQLLAHVFQEGSVRIKVIDLLGRQLYENRYASGDLRQGQRLDIAPPLSDGIYTIMIDDGKATLQERLVIKN